jgi:hypothetical protein
MNCSRHPEVATHTLCTRCSAPLCEACVDVIDHKTYCAGCAERLRARLAERQFSGAGPVPAPLPPANAPAARSLVTSWGGEATFRRGLVFASIAAASSLLLWYLLVTVTHAIAGLLAIAVGFIVGRAAFAGNGRDQDTQLGMIAAGITLLTIVVGEYLVFRGQIGRMGAALGARLLPSIPFFTFVGIWVDNVGALTLIGVVIGAGVAFLIPATGQLG